MTENLTYHSGHHNHFSSEAVPDTLPKGQNSPQRVAHGLYAEQLSGTAFTAPRVRNLRSWFYRIHPSVMQGEFHPLEQPLLRSAPFSDQPTPPTQLRWDPLPLPEKPTDFIQGLITMAGNGDPTTHTGGAIHHYAINTSMTDSYFYNADAELLFVPEQGGLLLKTEFGFMEIEPFEIAVIPRGVKFQVCLLEDTARGYLCENFGANFVIPDLGPIGANGLANPRDFQTPVARFEQKEGDFKLIAKFHGHLWQAPLHHSPLDVVAWHGNYVPYKYNLKLFNTINTVSFDHPDPSIFTVLTSQTNTPGVANIDFVIFPERWMVADHTFRPPYYHRNIMSEYMGLITGVYDAKENAFVPGGASLHNCMSAHGPDKDAYLKATKQELKPNHFRNTMAFMFESCFVWQPTEFALTSKLRQTDYLDCWQGFPITKQLP